MLVIIWHCRTLKKLKVTKKNLEMIVLNNQKKRYEIISDMIDG